MAEPLYFVTLPALPAGPQRTRLEEAFREAMNRQFGSEGRAAAALHAHVDSGEPGQDELSWSAEATRVCALFAGELPADAEFVCELNWKALGAS